MERITISLDEDVLKQIRQTQGTTQTVERKSVSISHVISACCQIAIDNHKQAVKNLIHDDLG